MKTLDTTLPQLYDATRDWSFAGLATQLGKRDECKIANNTRAHASFFRDDICHMEVYFHGTCLAILYRDGSSFFTAHSWRTATTRDRINRLLPYPWQVWQQKDGAWKLGHTGLYPDLEPICLDWDSQSSTTGLEFTIRGLLII